MLNFWFPPIEFEHPTTPAPTSLRIVNEIRRDDVRHRAICVTTAVCGPHNPDPAAMTVPNPPVPERQAMHKVRKERRPKADATDRWIELTERALMMAAMMSHGMTFEAAAVWSRS